MTWEVEVREGKFLLEDIFCYVDRKDLKIYYIDTKSKYMDAWAMNGEMLMIAANERSLKLNEEAELETVIEFHHPGEDDWMMLVQYGRYSVYVVFVKEPWANPSRIGPKQVWSRDKQ